METKPSSIKTIVTLSGVIGILLGIAMTYFLFPRVIKERNFVTNETRVVDTVYIEKERLVYRAKKVPAKEAAIKDSVQVETSLSAGADSLDTVEEINRLDTNLIKATGDTAIASLDSSSVGGGEEYVSDDGKVRVAENELVFVMQIKPSGDPSYFYCRDDNDNLDSLLMDNYVPKDKREQIRVEFWSSPINAVGYQLSKKRLVLYGFYEYKNVSLKYLEDGSVQMNYFDNEYVLQCGDEFRTLNIKK